MRYKEFQVKTDCCDALSKAVLEHALKIGYTWRKPIFKDGDFSGYKILYFYFHSDGKLKYSEVNSYHIQPSPYENLSIRDFFKLTKEDVIVEPERFNCTFALSPGERSGLFSYKGLLTQNQIDRIKEIMNEGDV